MMRRLPTVIVAALGLFLAASPAGAQDIERFYGVYVGAATDYDADGGVTGDRDIDTIISKASGGFSIEIVSVNRVDGRRDVPGVRRRVLTVSFTLDRGRELYVAKQAVDPFKESDDVDLFEGDTIEWAHVDGDALFVTTMVVREDGAYELLVYKRELTEDGLDMTFERIVDGEVRRRVLGTLIRVE